MERLCCRCKLNQPLDQYGSDVSQKDGRSRRCKTCQRELHRIRRSTGKENAWRNTKRRRSKEWLNTYKSEHPCVSCGESEPIVLDFHHLDPSIKEAPIFKMVHQGIGIDRILLEISKCALLCANCHRKVHAGLIKLPAI